MKTPGRILTTASLAAIMLAGLMLRLSDLSFPSIGYHNMRENEYVSIAYEMDRTGDYSPTNPYSFDAVHESETLPRDPQPPVVSYQTILAWKVFGENLWGPRLFNVIFGVLCILLTYLIAMILFSGHPVALFPAAAVALMPLSVFFSRNLQPETPAFFFMLLGSLLYLRFVDGRGRYNLVLGGLAFSAAWLYKFNFLIGVMPILFCLPYIASRNNGKGFGHYAASLILPYSLMAFAAIAIYRSVGFHVTDIDLSGSLGIFGRTFWKEYGKGIWLYMNKENFTPVFLFAAFAGTVVSLFRRKSLVERFISGWAAAVLPYLFIMAPSIAQANYYQMPFALLVAVSGAYAIRALSGAVRKFLKKDPAVVVMVIVILVAIPFAGSAITRMRSTLFPGADIAGETIRDMTQAKDSFFLLTHSQGFGIARYARRRAVWTNDLPRFKALEKDLNIRYICSYPPEFLGNLEKIRPELFDYIKKNYHVFEAGMTEEPQHVYYLVLEKGPGADPDKLLDSVTGKMRLRTIYRVLKRYLFFYAVRPSQ